MSNSSNSKDKKKKGGDVPIDEVDIKDIKDTNDEQENQEEQSEEITPEQKLQLENKELNDKLLRQMAEFDNYKKRTAKEKQELSGYTKSLCLQDFLNIIDNFERALTFESKDEDFKKGMEMILNQLNEAIKNQGVEEVEALGTEFNPEMHNAINQVEDENFGENTVCQVMQKGYKIGDRIIRHAMVVVANP